MWSEEGCSLTQETSTHVTCACNHLSSFAVIHVCCSLHPSLSACVALLQRCISTRDCMMLRLLLLMYCMLKPPLSAMQLALCYTASKHCCTQVALQHTHLSLPPPALLHACMPGPNGYHRSTITASFYLECVRDCRPHRSRCPCGCSADCCHCGSVHLLEVRMHSYRAVVCYIWYNA